MKRAVCVWATIVGAAVGALADAPRESEKKMRVEKTPFGATPAGESVDLYTCTNAHGLRMQVTNYGAIVVAIETPDRNGQLANITLGFSKLDGYLRRHPYFGSTVGRYCNRIARGKFTLLGKEYTLATNNGPNHLHGGKVGFDKVVWRAEPIQTDKSVGVRFSYVSPDGEEGYPGNLNVVTQYSLTNDNEWIAEYRATADEPTPVNLTNHNYWNLAGVGSGPILEHQLLLAADQYLPVDETLIPTGKLASVKGTPLDFTEPKSIGRDLKKIDAVPQGYDHCFVVRRKQSGLALAARVSEPKSGRVMEVHTTQPGIQLYTGNFLAGGEDEGGAQQYTGFCLETQHYPDSPNQPEFPTTILRPGETYLHTTVHKFSTQ